MNTKYLTVAYNTSSYCSVMLFQGKSRYKKNWRKQNVIKNSNLRSLLEEYSKFHTIRIQQTGNYNIHTELK